MQSNNPVFRRSEEFNSANAYGNQTYAGNGGYTDPATWNVGQPGQSAPSAPPVATGGPMTIDSVVQKTAIPVALVFAAAFVTWWWIGDVVDSNFVDQDALSRAYMLTMLGAGGAFLLSLVNSFKRVISPALVMLFALAEGVARAQDAIDSGAARATLARLVAVSNG